MSCEILRAALALIAQARKIINTLQTENAEDCVTWFEAETADGAQSSAEVRLAEVLGFAAN